MLERVLQSRAVIDNKNQCSYCGLGTCCLTLLSIKFDPSVSDLSHLKPVEVFHPTTKQITGL